jgi:hypothetical protein
MHNRRRYRRSAIRLALKRSKSDFFGASQQAIAPFGYSKLTAGDDLFDRKVCSIDTYQTRKGMVP